MTPATKNTSPINGAKLGTYFIASADMRFIEVNQREVILHTDPDHGLLIRGEVPGCGPGCYVDLAYVMLEYAMSCENCKDKPTSIAEATRFGSHLGKVLITNLFKNQPSLPVSEKLITAYQIIFSSLGISFSMDRFPKIVRISLYENPFQTSTEKTGTLSNWTHMGELILEAILLSAAENLAPKYEINLPQSFSKTPATVEILITE